MPPNEPGGQHRLGPGRVPSIADEGAKCSYPLPDTFLKILLASKSVFPHYWEHLEKWWRVNNLSASYWKAGGKMRDNQNLFSAVAVSALVAVCLFSAPTIATAVTTNLNVGESINLATVIDNTLTVQIGDKEFSDFSWSPIIVLGSDLDAAASNVNVKAISNPNDIGFRLEFQLPLTASESDFKDIAFQYKAAVVTNSSNLISDLHLSVSGTSSNSGIWSVSETAHTGGFGGGIVGFVDAASSTYSSSSNNIVPPQAELWIEKDIIVAGDGNPGDYASISAIEQTFSQIPEPSTALLVGLGLLGVVAVNRKRRS
jgi:hypothetical protein